MNSAYVYVEKSAVVGDLAVKLIAPQLLALRRNAKMKSVKSDLVYVNIR